MFSRDVKDFRYRTSRTLYEACGPYAKLHVPHRKSKLRTRIEAGLWMLAYGAAIGLTWYGCVLWRAA